MRPNGGRLSGDGGDDGEADGGRCGCGLGRTSIIAPILKVVSEALDLFRGKSADPVSPEA
jgi:hypothetical protein